MSQMRAKMRIADVIKHESGDETLVMTAVAKNEAYPEDGSDENNTYAKYTPSADLSMYIANPALHGMFNIGDEYYLDFTKVQNHESDDVETTQEDTSGEEAAA